MRAIFFSLLFLPLCHAEIQDCFKKIDNKTEGHSIRNVDFIYMINLDKRPERYEASCKQLAPYGIRPFRFSAVNGWELPLKALNEAGLIYGPGMHDGCWALCFSADAASEYDFLREACYGKTFFSENMTRGAIGCSLSHLSILQDAWDSGYETIWVMEDDIKVIDNPLLISDFIDKLDKVAGKNWDVLYTDATKEQEEDLSGNLWWLFRPDGDFDTSIYQSKRMRAGEFLKTGNPQATAHCIIYRRSGIKKILDFVKAHHLYTPYDHEISLPPGMNIFVALRTLIVQQAIQSDTQKNLLSQAAPSPEKPLTPWEEFKNATFHNHSAYAGWCTQQKADMLMDFIRETKPDLCVEIGAFGGSTTYPIARALRYGGQGVVYAIDAWDCAAAIEGLEPGDPNVPFWQTVNMEKVYTQFIRSIVSEDLVPWCRPIKKRSRDAVHNFSDGSIDMLYIDGNFSSAGTLEDAQLYFDKVKKGGHIWINDAHAPRKAKTIAFLMQRCEWLKDKSYKNQCIVFKKTT